MNPKFKKIIIIMIVIVVVGIAALFTYMGLSSVSNVTITNLMILDEDDKIMKDQYVYIGQDDTNEFKFKVGMSATGKHNGYNIYSTNPYVANVVYKNNSAVVQYYNSGKATIVVQSKDVADLKDTIDVYVYENYSTDLQFVDSVAENKKVIDVYADGLMHEYKFDLIGQADDQLQNARLFRVVEDSYDKSIIKSAQINSQNNTLEICANRYYDENNSNEIVKSSNEYIVLQSGIRDSNGDFIIRDNYIIKLNVICNTVEDMQLVISNNYGFNDDNTYVFSMLSDESKVQSTIKYDDGEKLMRKIFLNQNVRSIYFKVRIVMANGDLYYVTDNTTLSSGSGYNITKNSKTGEDCFATFTLVSKTNSPRISFNANLIANFSPSRESVSRVFTFIILSSNESDVLNLGDLGPESLNIDELYVKKNGVYTYSYYDARFKRVDTITDKDGNIIGFTGETDGIGYVMHDEDDFGDKDGLVSSYEQKKPRV